MPHTGAIAPFFQDVAFSQKQLQGYYIEEASIEPSNSQISRIDSNDMSISLPSIAICQYKVG